VNIKNQKTICKTIEMKKLIFSIFCLLVDLRTITGLCKFIDLVASCDMTLGGVPVTAYARVNHCHNPVDVTFQVLGKDPNQMSWRYTYVTTNLAENVVLSQHIMLAMMATQKEDGRRITIEARFLLDGNAGTELEFLNTDLSLPIPQKNCLVARDTSSPGWIAGACLLGLAVAAVVITLAIIKSRTGTRIPGHRIPGRLWRRFGHNRNPGSTVVQYVVPADTPSDLKVYVSTADGLQPVHNNNKTSQPNKAELQLTPINFQLQTAKSLKKKSNNTNSSATKEPAGISNSAFQWDEDEIDKDLKTQPSNENKSREVNLSDSDSIGAQTGAKPKS